MCGSPVVSSRIVGGTDAADGEWPWQIILYYNGRFLCGGSLIAPQWIMSAAHCFQGRNMTYYTVYLGRYQLNVGSPHTVNRTLTRVIINYQYTTTGRIGDISLAQLSSPVNYTEYIMPICLPSSYVTFPSGLDCWVTGWGTTSYGGSFPVNGTLQEVMTPLIDYSTCDRLYHNGSSQSASTVIVQSDKICSGYTDGGKDSCQGDSGGPLVCKVGGVWYEAGIVSWGEGCAKAYRPGVYTLVTAYQAWISSYVEVTFYNVTNMTNIPIQTTTTTTTTRKPRTTVRVPLSMCGSPLVTNRIVGGTNAADGEWPWQISLYYNGRFLCGGSLIAPQWIMSAAHCFEGRYTDYYTVYLGLYQLNVDSPHTVSRTLTRVIVNSQYTSVGNLGDISLAQLSSPVDYTDYIMPICLPSSFVTFPSGLDCWVTGWGTTSSGGQLPVNGILQEVMTPLIDYSTCDRLYHIGSSQSASTVIVQSDKICSGYTDGGKDSCQGDSGGPLVCKVGGVWYEAGIVSWGEGCAKAYRPGVYTLVTAYQAWISSYVQVTFYNVTNMTNIPIQTTTTTTTRKPRTTVKVPLSMCGSPLVTNRIVGGTNAADGEWPWQISLYYNGRFLCGGSLIAPQWIMSAAHCFQGRSTAYYTVYLGLYQLDVDSPHTVTRTLIQSIRNSQYTSTGDLGDISLAQLSSPVDYTEYIMPICLPSSSVTFPSDLDCWVTGWGTTSSGGQTPVNGILQEVMTPLIDYSTCDRMYHIGSSQSASTVIVQSDKICSGYQSGGKDSCQGDSGGPLVCKVKGIWYQAGIVSWGEGCAKANRPGIYTLVTAYQAWISSYVPSTFYNLTNIATPTTTITFHKSGGTCPWRPHWTLLFLAAFLLLCG
ncbi:transmembrane protease serine 9-like [Hyperolius riggenbachi]|uniref:transmembrane protease serine 9-like n=1 Tax=Hyperolius riggenbachi TaxID=752182 RepID=UPI0035A282BC